MKILIILNFEIQNFRIYNFSLGFKMNREFFNQDQEVDQIEYDQAGDKVIKGRELTMEQKMQLERAKKQHRQNIIKDQVVKGKVFKGASFISKPDKIVFKDFTVGKTHSQTIQLTNVSNAFNSFNILPLNEIIRNFFQIQYVPQGKISPGLSVTINIKFTPLANEDIQDEFCILAETGRIGYPIICTSMKSIVVCSEPEIIFGDIIFGEKSIKDLVIQNKGSLPTDFEIKLLDDFPVYSQDNAVLKFKKQGKIDGNVQLKIPFEVFPKEIQKVELKLQISFKNFKYSPPIIFSINWSCIQLPIYIEKELYDCQLVLSKHIYRRKLVFHNRSKNTMKLNIHQPSDTKEFFQFNPMMGYIQGMSEFQVWVKITIEKNPQIYLKNYSLGDGLYQVEFKVIASDQMMPVPFKIRFKLTSDIVKIEPDLISFGNIYENNATKSTLTFENTGQLLQQVQLYPIPKQITVQQNRSRFKILPKEKVEIVLIFQPDALTGTKSRKDEGQLCFKVISGTLSTQERRIKYESLTLKRELIISKTKLQLPAIQIDQKYSSNLEIKNVTGKQMEFEVFVPPHQLSGIEIMPLVGKLKPNQSTQLFVQYISKHRQLTYDLLQKIKNTSISEPQPVVQDLPPVEPPKKQAKKQVKKEPKLTKQQQQQLQLQKKQKQQQQKIRLQRQREERQIKLKSFDPVKELLHYGGKLVKFDDSKIFIYYWTIPIYFKFKGETNESSRFTFIEIVTTSTNKKLNVSQNIIDFGHVVVGTRQTKSVFVSSLEDKQQQLYKNPMSVFSGFSVVNSLRTVSQTKKFNLVVEFSPYEQQPFRDVLKLSTPTGSISCQLRGRGIRPEITLTPENGILCLGGVIVDEFIQKTFRLKNLTEFDICFRLNLLREGVMNKNNVAAISYIPQQGVIQGRKQIEIKVRFKPDRVSDLYYNLLSIDIPQQKNPKNIFIFGYAYPRQAYINYYKAPQLYKLEELPSRVQYVYDILSIPDSDRVFSQNNNKLILTFKKNQKQVQPTQECFKQKLVIGSCKVMDTKLQKPTAFQVIMTKDDRFTVDQPKGSVAPGTQAVITFTFKAPQPDKLIENIGVLQNVGQWKDTKVDLKLSGGFIKPGSADAITFEVTLRAYINQI